MGSRPHTHPSAGGPVVRVALFLCMGIVLSGCGGGDGAAPTAAPPSTPSTPPPPPAPTVASLEVSGTGVLTSIGEATQFMVTATLSDGSMPAVEAAEADWESSDPAVATVADGLLTAAGGGNATITATFGGQSAEVPVSVHISLRTEGTVRVLYVSPADRQFRADYSEGITHALVDLQSWYRRQTGGLTFSLYESTPEHCRLPESENYYARGDAWAKVQEDVQRCAPVEWGRSAYVWVLYVDVREPCDEPQELGRGGGGITMMPRPDLEGLAKADVHIYCTGGPVEVPPPLGRWIGGTGHELGHALADLRHPFECDEIPFCSSHPAYWSLMAYGFETYPDAHLTTEHRENLLRSPFIDGKPAPDRNALATLGGPRVQGTVRGPGGVPLEGIRISVWGDAVWNWGETSADGTFDLGMPEGASESAVVSVHGGKASDCRWLGYDGEGGLVGLRANATRVSIGDTGVTGIEIRLPGDLDALCRGPRTISGRVLGPDGRPVAEVWIGGFGDWSYTGRDGIFSIRQHKSTIFDVLSVGVECGPLGYYGPNGFTALLTEATVLERGPTDATGLEIRLPASPAELCRQQPAVLGRPWAPLTRSGLPFGGLPFPPV